MSAHLFKDVFEEKVTSKVTRFVYFFLALSCCLSGCDDQNEDSQMMSADAGTSAGVEITEDLGLSGETAGDDLSDMGGEMLLPDMGEVSDDMGLDMMMSDMMSDMEPDIEPDMEIGPPECINGLDDDEDGAIDYPRDPGCTDPEDTEEADPEVFACEDDLDNDEDGMSLCVVGSQVESRLILKHLLPTWRSSGR